MRLISATFVVATVVVLLGCTVSEDTAYLQAQQGPALKIPPHLSSYAMQEAYPVPAGANWQSSQPISHYPPGSSLAQQHVDASTNSPSEAISIGLDEQGSAALNLNESYEKVWAKLPQVLQVLGYKVQHSDPAVGLLIAQQGTEIYAFSLLKVLEGGSVLSVRNAQGIALSDTQSQTIMSAIKQQFIKDQS